MQIQTHKLLKLRKASKLRRTQKTSQRLSLPGSVLRQQTRQFLIAIRRAVCYNALGTAIGKRSADRADARQVPERRRSRSASGPMKKSLVVSIIQNKLFSKEIGCHSIFDVREQKTGHRLCDRLEFHFLELGNMKAKGLDAAMIAEITGLTPEEVAKL